MFEPIPELAPDLEWMLESGQAAPGMLAEALVEAFDAQIYHLALILCNDPQMARALVTQALASALANMYRYQSHLGVRTWLYQIALSVFRTKLRRRPIYRVWDSISRRDKSKLEANDFPLEHSQQAKIELPAVSQASAGDAVLWNAFDRLKQKERLPAALYYGSGWQVSEVAAVLKISEHAVQGKLYQARNTLRTALDEWFITSDELDGTIRESLNKRWPAPLPSKDELNLTIDEVLHLANRVGARQRTMTRVNEVALVGFAIAVVAGLIWGAERWLPEPEPTQVAQERQALSSKDTNFADEATFTPGPTATPIPQDVFYTVQPGDNLNTIASTLNTTANKLRWLNRIPSGGELRTGQQLLIPDRLAQDVQFWATPVIPEQRSTALSQPYKVDDVLARARQTWYFWNNLWLDARIRLYNTNGPPDAVPDNHAQLWLSRDQILLVGAPTANDPAISPAEVYLRTGGHLYRARPAINRIWFRELGPNLPINSIYVTNIRSLFDNELGTRYSAQDYTFQIVSTDEVAGREAVILERLNSAHQREARFWVDTQTGLVLRLQQFGGSDFQKLESEVVVTAIAFDVDFPQQLLFDPRLPWRGGFASDYHGEPVTMPMAAMPSETSTPATPLVKITPPAGFDPAHSRLSFQFAAIPRYSSFPVDVDLYADQYFVATLKMGNFHSMICARSPDGRQIAYTGSGMMAGNDRLHWFDLVRGADQVLESKPVIYAAEFAFSPDSRSLAIAGYEKTSEPMQVLILDTGSGMSTPLREVAGARSLAWSRDGQYLTFIERVQEPQPGERVLVFETLTWKIVYDNPLDFAIVLPKSWPLADLEGKFPVTMGSLDACTLPPGE